MSGRAVSWRWPVLAAVLLAIWAAGLGYRSWVQAQWRTVVVLTGSLHVPGLSAATDLTDAPVIRNTVVAGVPANVAVPPGGGRRAAVVFLNGATAAGRFEPHVERLTRALGEAGFITVVPDPPGLRQGELGPATLGSIEAVVEAVSRWPDVSRTGLLGVSVGCSLGLVAAETRLASLHLSGVACLAPYVNLPGVIEMALTGRYPIAGGRSVAYRPTPFLDLVIARSLAAALPPGPGRDALASRLLAISDNARDPLTEIQRIPTTGLQPPELGLLGLLRARTPAHFTAAYARIPAPIRLGLRRLSPLAGAGRLAVPVEIASSPHDSYFPLAQYGPFLRAAPDARLTVTSALGHAIPKASLSDPAGLLGLDEFAARSLRDLGPPVPVNWLAVAASLLALAVIAAQGIARPHGLVALAGVIALLAAAPALLHPTGLSTPLAVSAAATVAGAALGQRTGKRAAPNAGVE